MRQPLPADPSLSGPVQARPAGVNVPQTTAPRGLVGHVATPVGAPRALRGAVNAKARPGALPVPARHDVSAFTKPAVFEKWSDGSAGVRSLDRGDNVITMFDVVGEDFWTGGGITAKKVAAQLRAIGDRPVEVQINSPGGDMFEGIAIYNVNNRVSYQQLRAS